MSAKILRMPKSNQHLWDDLFNGFINQIDRAKEKFGRCGEAVQMGAKQAGAASADRLANGGGCSDGKGAEQTQQTCQTLWGEDSKCAGACHKYHGNLARYIEENAVVPAKREQPDTARELQENRGKAK